jgi:hypothetical protein
MGWRHEDGGPRRTALVPGGLAMTRGDRLVATSRVAPAFTMPSEGGVQSVLFPAPGSGRDFYVCTFLALTRVEVVSP